jgi:TRAP-type C4-dicarboxylate transport system permease small subunit
MPAGVRRVLSSIVDLIAIAFYGAATWYCIELALRTRQSMTSIDWPKSVIYWGATFGLAVATLYAIAIAWRHWRTRSSPLIAARGSVRSPDRPGME